MLLSWVARLFILLPVTLTITESTISGNFQVRLKSFDFKTDRNAGFLWRICLTNFQTNVVDDLQCKFSKEIHVDSSVLQSGIDLPFNFIWPGSFSLFMQSWTGPVPNSPIYSNILAFDKGFALTNTKAGQTWSNITLEDRNLASKAVIEYRIVCAERFYGSFCERTCIPSGTNVMCSSTGSLVCAPGWSGEKCDQAVCKQCGANGRCVRPGICQCDIGWTGESCEKCLVKSNCIHGTCQKPNECNCEKGWGGQYCDIDLEYCTRNKPCINGGTCQNTGMGNSTRYICSCLPGYSGKNCEVKHVGCPVRSKQLRLAGGGTLYCQNGGLCLQNLDSMYYCSCRPGYSGEFCEKKEIWCENKCQNGGDCIFNEAIGNYTCECVMGYYGRLCAEKFIPCEKNPCQNGGSCEMIADGFLCRCEPGFYGHFCGFSVNSCLTEVCANGGTCMQKHGGGYECRCQPGYIGRNCDIKDISCYNFPCGNGSTCIQTAYGHRCLCGPCYRGPDCRTIDEQCLIKIARNWSSMSESFLVVIAALTFLILVILLVFLYCRCQLRQPIISIDPVTENIINGRRSRLYQLPSIESRVNREISGSSNLRYKPVPVSKLHAYTKSNEYIEHQPCSSEGNKLKNDTVAFSIKSEQADDEIYAEVDECCGFSSEGTEYIGKYFSGNYCSELKEFSRCNCDRDSLSQFCSCIDIRTNV